MKRSGGDGCVDINFAMSRVTIAFSGSVNNRAQYTIDTYDFRGTATVLEERPSNGERQKEVSRLENAIRKVSEVNTETILWSSKSKESSN